MDYIIRQLHDELVYIRWFRVPLPNGTVENQYLEELKACLDNAEKPTYFISDLRDGSLISMKAIQKLGHLTTHENWAGSTAFTQSPVTGIFVRSFKSFARRSESQNEMQTTLEDALGFLESLKPEITKDIDWDALLQED